MIWIRPHLSRDCQK